MRQREGGTNTHFAGALPDYFQTIFGALPTVVSVVK